VERRVGDKVTTDPVEGLYRVCVDLARQYRHVMFFGGKLHLEARSWVERILHNGDVVPGAAAPAMERLPMTVIPCAPAPRRPPAYFYLSI